MRLVLLCLLVSACAHSTADIHESSKYVTSRATFTVDRALTALKEGDERSFRRLLSEERLSVYSRAFFNKWADEVKQYDGWSMGRYEAGKQLIEGTVTVVFKLGRRGKIFNLRIRFEDGDWRWHHK